LLLLKMLMTLVINLLVMWAWTLSYQYFGCRKHSPIMWWWSLKNDKLHLANIKVQVQKWITHNMNSIGRGLFVVNDNFIICEHTYTKMYHLKFLANN
jgi:hypothetical protein